MSNLSPIIDICLHGRKSTRDELAAEIGMERNLMDRVIDAGVEIADHTFTAMCDFIGISPDVLVAGGMRVKKKLPSKYETIGVEAPAPMPGPFGKRRAPKKQGEPLDISLAAAKQAAEKAMAEREPRDLCATLDRLDALVNPDTPNTCSVDKCKCKEPPLERKMPDWKYALHKIGTDVAPNYEDWIQETHDTEAQVYKVLCAVYERQQKVLDMAETIVRVCAAALGQERR